MKISLYKFIVHLFVLLLVLMPILSLAQDEEYTVNPEDQAWYDQYGAGGTQSTQDSLSGGLVPCQNGCKFNDFLTLVNNVVDFVLIKMFLPIAALAFTYAGFMIVTSGGDEHKLKKGKSIFWAVVIGFAVAVAAWIIVHTFLAVLGYEDASWIGF